MTEEDAKKFVVQPNYLSSLLVKIGEADGEICGIECPTADTYRPALQTIKTAPGVKIASSAILLEKGNESYVFGDVSLNLNPNAEELFNITKAISLFCKDKLKVPNLKVAMLSYSTNGSGKGESVDKVKQAFELVKQDNDLKNINIYGDIQFDAAFDEKVRTKKAPSLN
jgi:phosphate acetyltransferase